MKLYKSILTVLVVSSIVGCSYDDTEINNRLDKVEKDITELKAMVADINNNISALVTTVDALKNSDQITSVTPLADGSGYEVTFSKSGTIIIYNGKNGLDGEDGTDGSDGQSPQISVKLDIDGTYYWTVNGEWLLDEQGNKIPATAHIATPQIRINEGNFEISYNEGVTWEVIGDAGASDSIVFKQVIDGEASVLFILSDDTQIEIPKVQLFSIRVLSTDVIASPGETVFVDYNIAAGDENTVIDAFGTKGFEVELNETNVSSGSLTITVPAPMTNGKVYLIAVRGDGATAARILAFEEGLLTIDESAFAAKVPATGGTVEVPVNTNLQYDIMVDPSNLWIEYIETRAVRTDKVIFSVQENTSMDERTGTVIFMTPTGMMKYNIVQAGASDTPPVVTGGGSADLSTFNGGVATQAGEWDTYTSDSGWSVTDAVIQDMEYNFNVSGIRPILRGTKSAHGTLSSPTLSGGCGKVSFTYGRMMVKTGALILVEVKDAAGNVLKSETYTNDTIAQYETDTVEYDFNIAGDFIISITNKSYNNSRTVIDNFCILDFSWTGYTE